MGCPLLQLPFSPRVLTITAIAQLLVLGCTWVFGLFLFDPRSQVLAYAFTILNCLQGFFLFLMHCLLNKKVGRGSAVGVLSPSPTFGAASPDLAPWALQVREEYRKWACMVTGNKYSDFGTSTSSTSQNQTRVRANPGVGVQGQQAALGRNQSLPGSSLSRPSGRRSLACDCEVLARPAAPVASAAFAHTEDCPLLSHPLIPPLSCPQRRDINSCSLVPKPGTQGGVGPDGPASGCLCCTPAGTQGGQEPDRAAAPCPGTNTRTDKAPGLPIICLCYITRGQRAGVLLSC